MGSGLVDIRVCETTRRRSALKLVLSDLPAQQRAPLVEAMTGLRGEPLGAFDALVGAWERDRLVAAAWAQPQAGKTAAVWMPKFAASPSTVVARRLLDLAMLRADTAGVCLSQAMLESLDQPAVSDLEATGFRRAATLDYVEWVAVDDTAGAPTAPVGTLKLSAAEQTPRAELEQLVGQTYQKTRDCPELEGLRDVRDVLHGYRSAGDSADELWWVIRSGDCAVGVLFLTEHTRSRQMELTYMGLIPQSRGRGLAKQAVAAAQQTTRTRRCKQLVLAVDRRNEPARRVYRSAGFRAWAERTVFLRVPGASHGP
ncbi:MAG: GNAT family N-acetyltransferase [Planctomycetota bacterium]